MEAQPTRVNATYLSKKRVTMSRNCWKIYTSRSMCLTQRAMCVYHSTHSCGRLIIIATSQSVSPWIMRQNRLITSASLLVVNSLKSSKVCSKILTLQSALMKPLLPKLPRSTSTRRLSWPPTLEMKSCPSATIHLSISPSLTKCLHTSKSQTICYLHRDKCPVSHNLLTTLLIALV